MTAVVGFAVLTFVFAYLAINTPENHGPLQIGHYVLVHVMALFTGYVAYAESASGESLSDLMIGFTDSYAYLVYLIGAYFFIMILVRGLEMYSGGE